MISSVRAGGSDAAKSAEQLVKLTKNPLIKQYLPQITTKFLDAVAFSTAQDAVKNQENDPHTIELSDITATLKVAAINNFLINNLWHYLHIKKRNR